MIGDLWDHCHIGSGSGKDRTVDPFHISRDEADEPLDPRVGPVFDRDNNAQICSPPAALNLGRAQAASNLSLAL